MNTLERLDAALGAAGAPVVDDGIDCPTFARRQLLTARHTAHEDDQPTETRYSYLIDLFTTSNMTALKKKVKACLMKAGFDSFLFRPTVREEGTEYTHTQMILRVTEGMQWQPLD